MELDIAFFAKITGDYSTSESFLKASQARQKAMESVFWNAKMGQWLDYWLMIVHVRWSLDTNVCGV